ncbi:hypothetical protein [Vibrio parahaemolyticus]|uniref:hypothetical protein n=1 Tax=Vibrio parahaemolyticus TaxID=670 RepID=UPI00387A8684
MRLVSFRLQTRFNIGSSLVLSPFEFGAGLISHSLSAPNVRICSGNQLLVTSVGGLLNPFIGNAVRCGIASLGAQRAAAQLVEAPVINSDFRKRFGGSVCRRSIYNNLLKLTANLWHFCFGLSLGITVALLDYRGS